MRTDYQKRIEQLKARLTRNVKVQEGEKSREEPSSSGLSSMKFLM
jgi:hypothetical protein